MRGKVIAIHSSRGGTGKTVIAANLAAIYAAAMMKFPRSFSVMRWGIHYGSSIKFVKNYRDCI